MYRATLETLRDEYCLLIFMKFFLIFNEDDYAYRKEWLITFVCFSFAAPAIYEMLDRKFQLTHSLYTTPWDPQRRILLINFYENFFPFSFIFSKDDYAYHKEWLTTFTRFIFSTFCI